MIKLLLASPKGNVSGGIARWTEHVLNYYEGIACSKFQLFFFNTARKKQAPHNQIKRIYKAILEYPSLILGLYKNLRSKDFDILHFTSSASLGLLRDIIFIKTAKLNKTKAIIHFRFGRTPQILKNKNWECILLKYVVSIADKAIFIDTPSYESMKNHGFNNIELLPNPISPKVNAIINKLGPIEREQRSILFVGHCYKEKGVYELVEACKQISNVKLKLVGSIQSSIKGDLLQNGGEFITIVGEEPYEKIIEDMLRCDIFILPSYTEGFPNVILEAMACGCAIIATNVGAIPEMLDNDDEKKSGIVINPHSIIDLKYAINYLFDNEMLKASLRTQAELRVKQKYEMSVIWRRMENIWMNTLK